MANNIDIILKAIDQASPEIKKAAGEATNLGKSTSNLNEVFKSATGISLGAASAYAVAGMAIGKVIGMVVDATKETQAYNLSMIDMARAMGSTTEEASRLFQVADDVRVSQETITQAMRQAVDKGIQPNIAGLASLADKYVALQDPVAQGQFAIDTFGMRAGPEMRKLLELGGQGIQDYAAAINDSLVVTKEAAAQAELYYQNVDALTDSMTGLKMQIGNEVIPILNELLALDITTAINEQSEAVKNGGYWAAYAAVQLQRQAETGAYAAEAARWVGLAAEDAEKPTKELADGAGTLSNRLHGVAVNAGNAVQQIVKLSELDVNLSSSIGASIEQARYFAAGGKEIEEFSAKIKDSFEHGMLGKDAEDNLKNFISLQKQTAVESEQAMGKAGRSQEESIKNLQAVWAKNDEILSKTDAKKLLEDTKTTLGDIEGEYNVYIHVWYIHHGSLPTGGGFFGLPERPKQQFASGGDFVVPPGYPNDSFAMGVKSGERVSVEPANPSASSRDKEKNAPITLNNYGTQQFIVKNEQSLSNIMREIGLL